MSVDGLDPDVTGPTDLETLPEPDLDTRTAPEPVAHGAAVQAVFNDEPATDADAPSLYDRAHDCWQTRVGDRENEPYELVRLDHDDVRGLRPPREDRVYVLVFSSSRWKAGTGEGDDYSAWYQYHLKLRELDEDDGELYNPPTSIHLEILPQKDQLVYEDGNELALPYGEGTRVICSTTWSETAVEIESRMINVLDAAFSVDERDLLRSRANDSRRIQKAEAHVRFHIGYKRQLIDSLRQSEELIAFGGQSEIDAHRKRQREGWLEAVVDADRWHLLGFDRRNWNIEAKVYHAKGWADKPADDPMHHPKFEASFAGVDHGALPHVEEWDETMQTLRQLVSAHLEWSGVDRDDLVSDDYFAGSAVDSYEYRHPNGRREQLRARFENVSTQVYREALKANTTAVYDILATVATHNGATYDHLEDMTGLARSTIRYHVRRLEERDVVSRVGNPVLVVFPSRSVLEQAQEVLDRVFPDDLAEDRAERADDRRDRRERLDEPDSDDVETDADDDTDDEEVDVAVDENVDDLSTEPEWVSLPELPLTASQLADAVDVDHVEADHVRVRIDPYDWLE